MDKIDLMRRAIEMKGPACMPLEVVECPGVYDAYGTLDPWKVELLPGTEDFDSVQATYYWTLTPIGETEVGEPLRRDEWGVVTSVPHGHEAAYAVVEKPMADGINLEGYAWPSIEITDPFFERMGRALDPYRDRFLCGYIDPGPFLVAFNLLGYEGLLMKLHDDLEGVKAVFDGILEFQLQLVRRWREAGAHMVNIIDEFAGGTGLMVNPSILREHFFPYRKRMIEAIHAEGMYCGFCLDGDVREILPDFIAMGIDVLDVRQVNCMGVETVADLCKDVCVKASIDMLSTLAIGSPGDVRREARRLYEAFGRRNGGLIGLTLKWHRPEYPAANVAASVEAFNEFRKRP